MAFAISVFGADSREPGGVTIPTGRISPELAAEAAQIEAAERGIEETVWAKEMLADQCGRIFESFWDSLKSASNKLHAAGSFPASEFLLGRWENPQALRHGIEVWDSAGAGQILFAPEWKRFVDGYERAGWQLDQIELRHTQFDPDPQGQPSESVFYLSAHLSHSKLSERAVLEGDLRVAWKGNGPNQPAAVKRIDASGLQLKARRGSPPFHLLLREQTLPARNAYTIGPVLVYDLDGDGLSEIILPAQNLVYFRNSAGAYERRPLCQQAPRSVWSAVMADLDGDGYADLLCDTLAGLVLVPGSAQGTFAQPGQVVWAHPKDVIYPMLLTCGDIDRDGDLDVFVGQYKLPYEGGQMPTPYYNANDGYPAYLLLNDGTGHLRDATPAAGLEKKRWRRSFAGSFVDLNGDGNLDLAVTSDFAGLDLYRNDGAGEFMDITAELFPEPHGFGMGQVFSDFNADGRLDLLMTAMPSPTVDRLEHLKLYRPGPRVERAMRRAMTYGNRLYYGNSAGGFDQAPANDSIARSGWSWGVSAFDFDNDGFPEAYIANGMETRDTVRDYEREFWLHDIYVANSVEQPGSYVYLRGKVTRLRGRGESYGGYEKNRFYLNLEGKSFLEIGHLAGVALELDSRNVISDDLDGDGRVDLLVTCFEPWPKAQQTFLVYRNTLEDGGNWIGFHFRQLPGGLSPIGAQALIQTNGRKSVRQIVTGDSHRAQEAATLHFGLGSETRVEWAEIRWPTGERVTLQDPGVNRYHWIANPPRARRPKQ